MAAALVGAWTRFAATGNPNPAGSNAWPVLGTTESILQFNPVGTTLLPDAALLKKVFVRIDELLSMYASQGSGGTPRVVHAESRFKP